MDIYTRNNKSILTNKMKGNKQASCIVLICYFQGCKSQSRNTLIISYMQDWHRDTEPESDGEGFFRTQLPVIIFQMIEQNVS